MRTHHTITLLTAAALLTLTGCSANDPAPAADKPAGALAPSPRSTVDVEAVRSAVGLPPSPAPQQRATYLAALNAIDPEIVNGKDDKAISHGLSQCQSMRDEKDPTKRVASAERRFIGPTHPDGFGTAKSTLIVAAVQANLCPTY